MRSVEQAGSNESTNVRTTREFAVKRPRSPRLLSVAALLCGLALAPLGHAGPLQFALLAKRVDNPFFRLVGTGCAEAAEAQGDTCLLLGPSGPAHFRLQNEALEQALERNLDGIALAVIHSKWLAEHALQRLGKTPLITFDSDLAPAERHLRRGYVGLDNLAFGHRLGRVAQRLRPRGGTLCILSSSAQEPNLRERLQGLRQQLRGSEARDDRAERLTGENGWHELTRCPLYNPTDQQTALYQLATLLNSTRVDTLVSLGGWPTHQASEFRRQLGPLLAALHAKGTHPTLVIPTADLDDGQRALLDEGLVQAFLSMETREIGRQSYWMMKRLAQGLPVPEKVLVDSYVHLPKATPNATEH
ncbi:substrate-binding domain-containing protein [Azotobacter beijerinckii]|uniref:Ribose transport system substrate-binding protein n=1 Tax=Azotobacter beijerinckii TaxID=170623 RepID=A0A1I4FYW3_9GAMM|nr:substrate-binding domain-containing protein [Azotobacter beijerinckii]SFB54973.1 ribose transport system substrate-binding protein [Azotobacter beijerinckii]SFL22984.1 ribose transport system substrate-binding protein [Azotobacter beijerinckii]